MEKTIDKTAVEQYRCCKLCPRDCGVDRYLEPGFCGAGASLKINAYQLHHWEEPLISGPRGSGTIFFSHCSLKCVFCQNHKISHSGWGKDRTEKELSDIMLELQELGAHNINLVTPSHYTPQIISSIQSARSDGLHIPTVWNSSGYEKPETLKMLEGLIDIYLPDFKFFDPCSAERLASAHDYPEFAKSAILEMFRQVGDLKVENGLAASGIMIRILVMPGDLNSTAKTLGWISENLGNQTYISLMGQFYPACKSSMYPEINRCITAKEYSAATAILEKLGFENGFVQESPGSDDRYTPDFKSDVLP